MMDIHAIRDLVETVMIVGGVIWGAVKITSKFSALDSIPQKLDDLDQKVDIIDGKVENLSGQLDVYKSMTRKY